MSVAVALDQLADQIDTLGPQAFLLTIGPESKGHIVSVLVRLEDDALLTEAGKTTRANLTSNPNATFLWSSGDGVYSLIVDGTAEVSDGDSIAVRPGRAVLHRLAGADTDLPSCIRLEPTD